jgi:hypothetical protein
MEHKAKIDNKEFFKEYFNNESEFDEFYEKINVNERARKMLHQTARIISLADKLGDYIAGRPAINLLFYIITAELIAKLYYDYKGEGKSLYYVKAFFNDFCSDYNKKRLSKSIKSNDTLLNFEEVIEFFYKVRCDVVHEGNYYKYSFKNNDAEENIFANVLLPDFIINIQIEEVRRIIIESSIRAIQIKAKKEKN